MSEQIVEYTGGCLCGDIRYRVLGKPLLVANCHCSMCRGFSGSAFVTWASYDRANFSFTKNTPARFSSSPKVGRLFCSNCGTSIAYERSDYPTAIALSVGSMDRPDDFPPQAHFWTTSRLNWLHFNDDLPEHLKLPDYILPLDD